MRREIEAPDKEWLNAKEAASWLNIGDRAFRLLLIDGAIPAGRRLAKNEEYWSWRVVVAISIMLEAGHIRRKKPSKSAVKSPDPQKK
jgi:hypothetical protein